MDVEGAEILILPTMIDYLITNRSAVLISFHKPFYGENASKAVEIVLDILKRIYPRVSMADGRSIDEHTALNEPFFDLLASFDNG